MSDEVKPYPPPHPTGFWFYCFALIKVLLGPCFVAAVIVGLVLKVNVAGTSWLTLGIYGIVIISFFVVQVIFATLNRLRMNRVAKKVLDAKETKEVNAVIVGYREEINAWSAALQSLKRSTYLGLTRVIAVCDGDEEADQEMAEEFVRVFPEGVIVSLPESIATVYKRMYDKSLEEGHTTKEAEAWAWKHTSEDVRYIVSAYNLESSQHICFLQPHGHKRIAMFTGFLMALEGFQCDGYLFTTDSDTLVDEDAIGHLVRCIQCEKNVGAVTGDVKIWNKSDSFLARMCSLRYWFAFNIERACQSFNRAVLCVSGPLGLYDVRILKVVLGSWVTQKFAKTETTFGDDRHLTNQVLHQNLKVLYTHHAYCYSDAPATVVRWIKQQTRWGKSFYRELLWFPKVYIFHSPWLCVEMSIQAVYPFILAYNALAYLYGSHSLKRLGIFLVTVWVVGLVRALYAFLITLKLVRKDEKVNKYEFDSRLSQEGVRIPLLCTPWVLYARLDFFLFSFYGFYYFFFLIPAKMYAMLTPHLTQWGTSARSASEMRKGDSFMERTSHVIIHIPWFIAFVVGVGRLLWSLLDSALGWLVILVVIIPLGILYWDVIKSYMCCCVPEVDLERQEDDPSEKMIKSRLISVDNSSWPTYSMISKEFHSHSDDEASSTVASETSQNSRLKKQ
ncbi:hypothetical protein K493DRAFT_320185 [Basidiobolus meristosporus CBS 931.73]|uniref:Glycosyltransferase 2-like domain-containing protein n=1 Tax=Basidiobolus meristosporus CBS 931.73 TaxID=1314790 RepID=A0A1Y1XEQ2_9FUNG|nr:hypothetical protein K493DRAFT_320185 [Basidiobolus meristosporus CBS 931.73]|eukprot:ORX83916.1 hypothetical protein K493DRAFT_320185 [Basidiobolus meristosporus CBS 931.73]